MQKENPSWSAQRIQGELGKLRFSACDNTIAKYIEQFKKMARLLASQFLAACITFIAGRLKLKISQKQSVNFKNL
jgi:hypothetical protein